MVKHGAFYGTRPLPGGKFGILVKVYVKGAWVTTDMNTTPWPTKEVATDRARRAAVSEAEREGGLPVMVLQ